MDVCTMYEQSMKLKTSNKSLTNTCDDDKLFLVAGLSVFLLLLLLAVLCSNRLNWEFKNSKKKRNTNTIPVGRKAFALFHSLIRNSGSVL